MKVIWKFEFEPGQIGHCTVTMPKQREHLAVGRQPGPYIGEHLVMWAAVDPESGREDVPFVVVGTGMEIPEGTHDHRGTVQMADGLVWHVLECQP